MEHNFVSFRLRKKSIERAGLKMSHLRTIIILFMGVVISMTGCNTNTIFPPIPTNAAPATYIIPTLEIVPSPTLLFDNHLKPIGTPLLDWNNIPIMPQAIAGEEYQDGSYSYTINKSMEEVQAFYIQELIPRGWKPFNGEFERKSDGAVGIFEKDVTIINVTISPDPNNSDGVVVILHNN